ncbi:hypothetical protein UA08_03976 [Talaromyces atroroseus]|uniref:Uncharacterized protein n=1 Tax=Talaromyces atroroseus TaxID=1441469 RepID=A0A1Q5Q8N0_TALAT|nr:hypothetical protein UA08_03976 [Talaromyces atroroseus]OKL60422.1 hypothetical protein UA08_03976 [Talaromyces atroroseus]
MAQIFSRSPKFSNGADLSADTRIRNLREAAFICEFRCRLGNPRMSDPSAVPDFVTLGTPARRASENSMRSALWNKNSTIPGSSNPRLICDFVRWEFAKLPRDVQDRIKNLGNTAFSIEQLIFDFSNASLSDRPQWVNPDTTLGKMLMGGPFGGRRIKEGKPEDLKRYPEGDTIFEMSRWKPRTDSSLAGWDTAKVQFKDSSIIITQHIEFYVYIRFKYNSEEADVLRKTITDTYSLVVDTHGKLQVAHDPKEDDTSEQVSINLWTKIWPECKNKLHEVRRQADLESIKFHSIPVTVLD